MCSVRSPAGICAGEVRMLAEEAGRLDAAYALIFNWRARPLFRRMKELLEEGVPGHITRIVWISNIWYRTPAYHNAALWRSSWNGEGGGVLINQGQHLLDMWQWLFGEPDAVRAFIDFGKFNDITVDDNADLFFEYKDGRKGTFITSTGEAPAATIWRFTAAGAGWCWTEIRWYLKKMRCPRTNSLP